MKKTISFGIISISIMLWYIFLYTPSPDEEAIDKEIEEDVSVTLEASSLGAYVDDISYKIGEREKGEEYDYPIDLVISLKGGFNSIPDNNKLKYLSEIYKNNFDDHMDLDRSGQIYCGRSDCQIRDIFIRTDEDQYRFLKRNYNLIKNGTTIITLDDVREQEADSAENAFVTISKTEIYTYMKNAYDKITNYGESYNPEVHDPMIDKMTADKFGISESEANQIYIDYEMNKY